MQRDFEVLCRPVLMDAVCSSGSKCFHNTHYLYLDQMGNPIPEDACIVNCRVNNLLVSQARRVNDCYSLNGTYLVRVWFEYLDAGTGLQEVTWAEKTVGFNLRVPAEDIAGGCVQCDGQPLELCWVNTRLHCIEACLEPVPLNGDTGVPTPYQDFPVRIRVVVEKEFFVMETGRSIVCLPVCPPDQCVIPPIPIKPVECPACVEEPVECDDWCAEDEELTPGECAQCPPPQVGVRER